MKLQCNIVVAKQIFILQILRAFQVLTVISTITNVAPATTCTTAEVPKLGSADPWRSVASSQSVNQTNQSTSVPVSKVPEIHFSNIMKSDSCLMRNWTASDIIAAER